MLLIQSPSITELTVFAAVTSLILLCLTPSSQAVPYLRGRQILPCLPANRGMPPTAHRQFYLYALRILTENDTHTSMFSNDSPEAHRVRMTTLPWLSVPAELTEQLHPLPMGSPWPSQSTSGAGAQD